MTYLFVKKANYSMSKHYKMVGNNPICVYYEFKGDPNAKEYLKKAELYCGVESSQSILNINNQQDR